MSYRLIIDGNSVYEIDEDCEAEQKREERENTDAEKDKGG